MPLTIRLALLSDADDMLDFLRRDFYPEEPLRQSVEPRLQPEEDEEFVMANLQYNVCLIAEDNVRVQDDLFSNQIIGVLIVGPKYPGETDHLIELSNVVLSKKWAKILKLFAFVEQTTNVYERYHVPKAAHCYALAVSPGFRGRQIGRKLIQKCMEIVFKNDFKIMTFDCTSLYGINICENLNMECIHTLAYTNYCDENGHQVFYPAAPHRFIKTFVQRIAP